MRLLISLLAILAITSAVPFHSDSRQILLHNQKINTRDAASCDHGDDQRTRDNHESMSGFYIHLENGVSHKDRVAIEDFLGQELDTYIPHNTYLVYLNRDVALAAQKLKGVLWVGDFVAEHKVPEDFIKKVEDKIQVLLVPYTHRTMAETHNIANHWSKLTKQDTKVLSVDKIEVTISKKRLAKDVIKTISERPESYFFETPAKYESHNAYASAVIQSNSDGVNPTPYTSLGINGSTQTIGLADSGLTFGSCFFGSATQPPSTTANPNLKVVRYITQYGDNTDGSGHGTAVAGTIAGNDPLNTNQANGINANAKIHFTDIQNGNGAITPPSDLSNLFTPALNDGVKVYVLPFGSDAAWYTSDSQTIDRFTSTNDFLVITSAGNTKSSLSGLALSKNALVVGASMSSNEGVAQAFTGANKQGILNQTGLYGSHVLANFSSVGPTPDGRIKPDIVAPGKALNTASKGTCGTQYVEGTSYSAGVAAAAAAIVGDYYNNSFYPTGQRTPGGLFGTPTADLLKAILINSGESLTMAGPDSKGQYSSINGIPDSRQGYGRIQLDNSLYLNTMSNYFVKIFPDSRTPFNTGDNQRICLTTTTDSSTLKATLVWMDKEASPLAGHILVNDLDLLVWDNTGVSYKPQSGNGYFDSTNNVEQVYLTGLQNGRSFSVQVNARSVPSGPQNWVVVVSGNFAVDDYCFNFEPEVCAGDCSGFGTCINGACNCTAGRTGADCSITPCPLGDNGIVCAGNGVCDFSTSTCQCMYDYAAPLCNAKSVPVPTNSTTDPVTVTTPKSPYTAGLVAGSVIAAFFVGAICSVILGGFLAVKYLEHRRDKAAKERQEEMQ